MVSTVKLLSVSALGAVFIGLTSAVQNAKAAVVYESIPSQTLNLDAANPNHIDSNIAVRSGILDAGTWYKFVVSGSWSPDKRYAEDGAIWQVDARFVTQDLVNWTDQDDLFDNFDFGLASQALGAGNDDFWGAYKSDNIYTFEFLGQGQAVDFYINDIAPESAADNAGGYVVKIYTQVQAIPTPALLPGLIGLGIGILRKRQTKATSTVLNTD